MSPDEPVAPTMVYFNKSRDECDQRCHRACYWNEWALGTGIEPVAGAYELAFGQWWHEGAAEVLGGVDPLEAATSVVNHLREVQQLLAPQALTPGWDLRCTEHQALMFALVALLPESKLFKDLSANYAVVDVEREIAFHEYRGEYKVVFSAKPDVLVRRLSDQKLVYIEFKTTGYFKDGWFKPYKRSPQLLGASLAVQQCYNEPLDHVIVQPINKGSAYKDVWDSPACYLWRNMMGPVTKWSIKRPTAWTGWEKVSAADVGWDQWSRVLLELGAQDILFPEAPPIYVSPSVIDGWWEQRCRRRLQMAEADARGIDEDVLASVFPQNFSECEPMMGRACQYLNACWIDHVGADPLAHGFAQKQSHSAFDPRRVEKDDR